jgi:cytosine/adenosine deaminase-related metal-dependent hydrolase
MILKARHVVPVTAPPIENGVVELRGERIVEVRRARTRESDDAVIDCGDSLLLPGFVNAHTHLELSHLAGRVPPAPGDATGTPNGLADFTGWLRRLTENLKPVWNDSAAIAAATTDGAQQCLNHGVTTVGDITRSPHITRGVLRKTPLTVVSFGEVIAIGGLRKSLDKRLGAAMDTTQNSDRLAASVSPHAPYTCDRRALVACRKAASRSGMRVAMHLAESADEETCTVHGIGPLIDFLRSVGVWDEGARQSGLRPVACAEATGLLGPEVLLAHVNYVNEADIQRLAHAGVHVAYCPRTHAAFGHPPHRWREMLAANVNVCVGTDSLASNPSLSVVDELRHLRRMVDDFPAEALLEMGTIRAARALGLEDRVGSLQPGKRADVAVFPCAAREDSGLLDSLLYGNGQPTEVYAGGRRVRGS